PIWIRTLAGVTGMTQVMFPFRARPSQTWVIQTGAHGNELSLSEFVLHALDHEGRVEKARLLQMGDECALAPCTGVIAVVVLMFRGVLEDALHVSDVEQALSPGFVLEVDEKLIQPRWIHVLRDLGRLVGGRVLFNQLLVHWIPIGHVLESRPLVSQGHLQVLLHGHEGFLQERASLLLLSRALGSTGKGSLVVRDLGPIGLLVATHVDLGGRGFTLGCLLVCHLASLHQENSKAIIYRVVCILPSSIHFPVVAALSNCDAMFDMVAKSAPSLVCSEG